MAEHSVQVTQSTDHALMDTIYMGVTLLLTYYILDPNAFERHKQLAAVGWRKLEHQVSVWQAKRDIQNLPETDDSK